MEATLSGKKPNRATGPKLVGQNAFMSIAQRIEGRRVRIGSASGNDLVLAHQSVSARHALIRRTLGSYYLRDLGSANGTFLNGRRIETEQPLRLGDEMRFGAARFTMVAGAKPAPALFKYLGGALGLLLFAGAGYLSINFVHNWENVEKVSSATQTEASSIAINDVSPVASAAETKPAVSLAQPAWLAAINRYRAEVKLPPVAEDPKLSDADRKHSMYVVKNYEDKVGPDHLIAAEMHDEEKGNPWYTPEGQAAGAKSDVNQQWGREKPSSPLWAIDSWLSGPFHRLWILNPRLQRVGYGEFCEKKYCVAALDLGGDLAPTRDAAPLAEPIEFPADKSIATQNSLGGEWPTPLTSCPGYASPAGLPATIQLGTLVEAKLSAYQITRDGHRVEACGIDATNYRNPVAADQERGREIPAALGAAMIIPRQPLERGATYQVNATVNGHAYQWSFAVSR